MLKLECFKVFVSMYCQASQMVGYSQIIPMLILFNLGSLNFSKPYHSKNLPLWTWECVNEKCVPSKMKSMDRAHSLVTCNMLCASMHLWPQPTGPVSLSTSAVPVRADLFQIQIEKYSSIQVQEHLRDAFDLFKADLRKLEREAFGFHEWQDVELKVFISQNGSADPRMLLKTDESYNLTVKPVINSLVVEIDANSFCGARHGLETLSQLIWFDPYVGSLFMMEAANVEDAPRFRYRGVLLDTVRNYFPVSDLLRTIDAMAACKLNTFHWHASDSHAFTLLLQSVPELAQYDDYSSIGLYSPDDIRMVVKRARLRGIRVLLEVDIPSYVSTVWDWRTHKNFGEIKQCIEKQSWNALCTHRKINPQNYHLFDVLESMYSEILELTDVDDIFHIGGEFIVSRYDTKYFNSSHPDDIWLEFMRKALRRLKSVLGKLPDLTLMWSSHLSQHIKTDLKEFVSNIGLQVRSFGWAQKYVSGVRTVISHEDTWDLNSGLGAWHDDSDGAPYNSWQRVYEYRPMPPGSACIEGGEVTVWSSTLSPGGLDARVWPRAAAFAERMWSDRPEGATKPVQARLDIHRSRLLARSIQVSPLWSMWCTHNPYTCD